MGEHLQQELAGVSADLILTKDWARSEISKMRGQEKMLEQQNRELDRQVRSLWESVESLREDLSQHTHQDIIASVGGQMNQFAEHVDIMIKSALHDMHSHKGSQMERQLQALARGQEQLSNSIDDLAHEMQNGGFFSSVRTSIPSKRPQEPSNAPAKVKSGVVFPPLANADGSKRTGSNARPALSAKSYPHRQAQPSPYRKSCSTSARPQRGSVSQSTSSCGTTPRVSGAGAISNPIRKIMSVIEHDQARRRPPKSNEAGAEEERRDEEPPNKLPGLRAAVTFGHSGGRRCWKSSAG
uniref:Uncharacterized protein n=1 Tax=Tetraselmis sp. GSL018 TaxID=582737 RepID=A0A061RMC4_9CHLO